MSIARDASSPARFNLSSTTTASGTESGTSASFTPPANAWVYCSACINSTAASPTFSNPTNTGGGLGSWTLVKSQANASGGSVAVWRAFVNSSVATTVTVSVTGTGSTAGAIPNDAAAWCDVWTGAATSQTGAATGGSTSTTANISPSITTTASGSQVAGVAVDWQAAGTPTSTDTIDGYTQTGQTSGGRAYKASNSGAAGAVTVNFHSPGTPQWAYALYEILAPAGGSTFTLGGQSVTSTEGTITDTVSYSVSGQSITSTLGTISPAVSYATVGQAVTSVLGTIVPTVSYGLTGQSIAFTEGAITASTGGDLTLTLAGQAIASTLGTITPTLSYSAAGQAISSSEGTLSSQASYALQGQSLTLTEGSPSGKIDIALNGQSINTAEGAISANIAGDQTVSIGGLSAAFSLGQITVSVISASADAGRKRIREIYRIKIDGHTFECRSLAEALEILDKAKRLAEQVAQKAPQAAQPKKIAPPRITTNTPQLRKAVTETRQEIRKTYERANIDMEIALLMELDDRHNDDAITLLM